MVELLKGRHSGSSLNRSRGPMTAKLRGHPHRGRQDPVQPGRSLRSPDQESEQGPQNGRLSLLQPGCEPGPAPGMSRGIPAPPEIQQQGRSGCGSSKVTWPQQLLRTSRPACQGR